MPENPSGKDDSEYRGKESAPKYNAVSTEEELGDMHFSTENFSVAMEYYEKSLEKLRQSAHSADLSRLYRKMCACCIEKGLLQEAIGYLKIAEASCDENDNYSKGTISRLRGIILRENGALERALQEAFTSYSLLRGTDDHREVARALVLIAVCQYRIGKRDEAEQYFLDALATYRRAEDLVGEAHVLNSLGIFHKDACRFGRSIHFFERALALCEKMGLVQHRARVTLNLGITHLKMRNFAKAASIFAEARRTAQLAGNELLYVRSTLELGLAQVKTSEFSAAEKHLLEARVIAERRGYSREIALADEYIGDLMSARGDLEDALQNYSTALARAKKISAEGDIVAEVLRREVEIFLRQRKAEDAVSVGSRAIEIAIACGEIHEVGYLERAIGLAYAMLGRKEETERYITDSIKTFRSANNTYEANRTCLLFAEQLLAASGAECLLKTRKLVIGALAYFEQSEEFRDLLEAHFLLARIERELKNQDECLLHLYEAQRIAEDLRDHHALKRIRRLRRSIEEGAAGQISCENSASGLSGEIADSVSRRSHLSAVLDYLLTDLLQRTSCKFGFLALLSGEGSSRRISIPVRRDISESSAKNLSRWYLDREDSQKGSGIIITDVLGDRRTLEIRKDLPGSGAPFCICPLKHNNAIFGLVFIQTVPSCDNPTKIGNIPDLAASYVSFIELLIHGGSVPEETTKRYPGEGIDAFRHILTRNERMLRVLSLAEKVARSDTTVLLMGETGTGKGLIARAIHNLSSRRSHKFVHLNCAALPETILESELFGHIRGSFTGAVSDKKGLLAEAEGGTVFLDEIGKTSLFFQGKLLQFLDEHAIRPVGGNELVPVNVRLIFASKIDPASMVADGAMLEDLYYRINDFPISVPPLRERVEDIDLLAEYFLKVFCESMKKRLRGFSKEARDMLISYEWPGNVRELEKVIKRAVILGDDDKPVAASAICFDAADSCIGYRGRRSQLPDRIKELEKRMISESLVRNGWNRSSAAAELGISYPTLLKKIRDLRIARN